MKFSLTQSSMTLSWGALAGGEGGAGASNDTHACIQLAPADKAVLEKMKIFFAHPLMTKYLQINGHDEKSNVYLGGGGD